MRRADRKWRGKKSRTGVNQGKEKEKIKDQVVTRSPGARSIAKMLWAEDAMKGV